MDPYKVTQWHWCTLYILIRIIIAQSIRGYNFAGVPLIGGALFFCAQKI